MGKILETLEFEMKERAKIQKIVTAYGVFNARLSESVLYTFFLIYLVEFVEVILESLNFKKLHILVGLG